MGEDIRYPIGEFHYDELTGAAQCAERVTIFRDMPKHLRAAVNGLNEKQLDTPYRDGGWSVRQVVHHLGDANIHFYCRTKATMTEARPNIVGFDETDWIKSPDNAIAVDATLILLDGLHARWDALLCSMQHEDYSRTFMHSSNGETVLDRQLAYAAWHCRHHVAQITSLRKRMNW